MHPGYALALVTDLDQAPAVRAARPLWERPGWLLPVAVAVVGLPLMVAVVALAADQWYPVLDLAMTEFRVRDVGTSHTPADRAARDASASTRTRAATPVR